MLERWTCPARDILTDSCEPGKKFGSQHSAETTGNLLLHLGVVQIVLTLVVGEWHTLIPLEMRDILLDVAESLQQVSGL